MFINFTPHDVVVFDGDGREVLRVPSSGSVRAKEVVSDLGAIDGIAVVGTKFADLEGPEMPPAEGVTYIVSPFVGGHPSLSGRTDVVCPDTGPASVVRCPENPGWILGVTRLRRLLP